MHYSSGPMYEKIGILQSEKWVQSFSVRDRCAYRHLKIIYSPSKGKEGVSLIFFSLGYCLATGNYKTDFYLVFKYESSIVALADST